VRRVTTVRLVVVGGVYAGKVFEAAGSTVIGRDPSAGIVVEDPEVSRRHASISLDDEGVVVTDLGSLNGTWVEGERIDEPRVLSLGQKLRVGQTVLEVQEPPAQETIISRRDTVESPR
jgi:pSer/pThr/pTyr-binding forkhead associated (FHA) protein